jgi:hypothetical protein
MSPHALHLCRAIGRAEDRGFVHFAAALRVLLARELAADGSFFCPREVGEYPNNSVGTTVGQA